MLSIMISFCLPVGWAYLYVDGGYEVIHNLRMVVCWLCHIYLMWAFLEGLLYPSNRAFFTCMHIMYNYDSSFAITCCAWRMYSSGKKKHEVKTSVKCLG